MNRAGNYIRNVRQGFGRIRRSPGGFSGWQRKIGLKRRLQSWVLKTVDYGCLPFKPNGVILHRRRDAIIFGKPQSSIELSEHYLRDFLQNLQRADSKLADQVLGQLSRDFYAAWQVLTAERRVVIEPNDGPKGEQLDRILNCISIASEYVDQIGAIVRSRDFIEIKYKAARLIGLIGWRYPDKIKDALPTLVNELEKILIANINNSARQMNEDVELAINIVQSFDFIAETNVFLLEPFSRVLEIGSRFWEQHIQHISQRILKKVSRKSLC